MDEILKILADLKMKIDLIVSVWDEANHILLNVDAQVKSLDNRLTALKSHQKATDSRLDMISHELQNYINNSKRE